MNPTEGAKLTSEPEVTLDSMELLVQIVALMIEARDGGWEIRSYYTGDFHSRDYHRIEFWRTPPEPAGRTALAQEGGDDA